MGGPWASGIFGFTRPGERVLSTQWIAVVEPRRRLQTVVQPVGDRPTPGQHKQQRGRRPADREVGVGVGVTVLPGRAIGTAFDEPLAGLAETRLVAGVQAQGLPAAAQRLGGVRPLGCPSRRGHHRQVIGDRVAAGLGVELVDHTGGGGRIGAVNDRIREDPAQPKSVAPTRPSPAASPFRNDGTGIGAGRGQQRCALGQPRRPCVPVG